MNKADEEQKTFGAWEASKRASPYGDADRPWVLIASFAMVTQFAMFYEAEYGVPNVEELVWKRVCELREQVMGWDEAARRATDEFERKRHKKFRLKKTWSERSCWT